MRKVASWLIGVATGAATIVGIAIGLPILGLGISYLITQNRDLAMQIASSDHLLPLPAHDATLIYRLAGASPLGAAEYHRSLIVRRSDGRSAEFPLFGDWGGIRALSIYTDGRHLRVLDCVTGFDVDLANLTSLRLPEEYQEQAVLHLGSFVHVRGAGSEIQVAAAEPMPLREIAASC